MTPLSLGRTGKIVRHAVLITTALFALIPFIWMLSLSIKPESEIFQRSFHLLPSNLSGLNNYAAVFASAPIVRFLFNGVVVCGAIFMLQLLVSIPCAYALAKLRFRGRDTLFAAVLVVLLIPSQVLSIPHFIMLHHASLLDTYGALILPWVFSAFGVFLLRQFFLTIPDELIHAAQLDGMSEAGIIWRIMIPMSGPVIAAFGIFSVVSHWNDLFWPLIALRSMELSTPALGILLFRDEELGRQFGSLMAATTIIVVPLIAFFLMAQRRFIDGLTIR
ncbi:MAG: carbohydrate ABC transporter permease [Desulfovibrionaceae bacterium]|nr:carbohydrate ABC transporter permease [Desulfovibrionaceae bacterium]